MSMQPTEAEYWTEKQRKLQIQFAQNNTVNRASVDCGTKVLAGLCCYINGRTNPPLDVLRSLVYQAGLVFFFYFVFAINTDLFTKLQGDGCHGLHSFPSHARCLRASSTGKTDPNNLTAPTSTHCPARMADLFCCTRQAIA